MVRNTPDDDEYRGAFGFSSYRESILNNCALAQNAQKLLLGLMLIAGAQSNEGRLTLDGGKSHPPGMQRQLMQHVHFITLVGSNFSSVLRPEELAFLNDDWDNTVDRFVGAGLLPIGDLETLIDPREYDAVEAAANAIEEMNVEELRPAVPVLRDVRDILTRAMKEGRR
jgi:hypothetical protein